MAMSTGGKVAVAFGVLTGVGVGLYFLLKPSTASAATTNPLAVAQAKALAAQRAAAALQVAAKSSGSAQDLQKAALAVSAAKVLADAAKNIKIGGGSAKTQPNSSKKTNANVPSIPTITNAQKSTMADAYYCNYNPDDVKCGGQGLPSDLCQTSPEAPECQALLESSDYCTKYPQNCDSSGETYCSLYPDAYYCGGSGSGSDSFDTTPIDTGSDWQSYDWYCYDNPQYC